MKKLIKIMASALITTALFMSCGNPAATGNPDTEESPDFKLNGTYTCSTKLAETDWVSTITINSYDKTTESGIINYKESKSWIELLYPEIKESEIIKYNSDVLDGIVYNYSLEDYYTYSKDINESGKAQIEKAIKTKNVQIADLICFEIKTTTKSLMHGDNDFIFFDKNNINIFYVYNYLIEDEILTFIK